MFGRITVSLALFAVMFTASARSTSATCILVNSPSQKACAPACCKNKSCCETSRKRTGDPVQPFSARNSLQKDFVVLMAVVPTGKVEQPRASEISGFSFAERLGHSPPTLALLCIRLI